MTLVRPQESMIDNEPRRVDMEREPASVEQPIDDMSPDAVVHRFRRMIEIYATKTRLSWQLPASDESELHSYGNVGLSEALARFDASRGVLLGTYAEHRIRGAIQNGAKALARSRRLAAQVLSEREADAGDKWDRILDLVEEVAIGTAVTVASAEDDLLQEEQCQQLQAALAALPKRSQDVLRWLFVDELSGVEVAAMLGVHKSSVTRIRTEALSLLARKLAEIEMPGGV
jgi:RNA polymerase sigma factor (sigma-70 family)